MTVSVGFWREGGAVSVTRGAHGSGALNAMKDLFVTRGSGVAR